MDEKFTKQLLKLGIKESQLQYFSPFDSVEIDPNANMGTLSKAFVYCSGAVLGDLYDDIHNNSINIETCANRLILSVTKEEFAKLKIPVVIKPARFNDTDYPRSEFISCRVCDSLNLKTSYSVPLDKDYSVIISADFFSMKEGIDENGEFALVKEEMETFDEFTGVPLGRGCSIFEWMIVLESTFEKSKKCKNLSSEQKTKIIEDFIKQFIVRKFVLREQDLNAGNVVFVYTGSYDNLHLGPAFDFEHCLGNEYKTSLAEDTDEPSLQAQLDSAMKYLSQKYPAITEKIMSELDLDNEKKSRIKAVFDKFGKGEAYTYYGTNILYLAIENMQKTFASYMQNTNQDVME